MFSRLDINLIVFLKTFNVLMKAILEIFEFLNMGSRGHPWVMYSQVLNLVFIHESFLERDMFLKSKV